MLTATRKSSSSRQQIATDSFDRRSDHLAGEFQNQSSIRAFTSVGDSAVSAEISGPASSVTWAGNFGSFHQAKPFESTFESVVTRTNWIGTPARRAMITK